MPLYSVREATGEIRRGTVVALIGGAAVLLVALALTAMAVFGFGFFSQSTANYRGETDKRNLIEANGAFRTGAYDHFYDLCAHVQSDESSIKNLQYELNDKANPPTVERKAVLIPSLTALRNNRSESINQYNVDTRKGYTEGQFKADDLPSQLDLNAKETTCHS